MHLGFRWFNILSRYEIIYGFHDFTPFLVMEWKLENMQSRNCAISYRLQNLEEMLSVVHCLPVVSRDVCPFHHTFYYTAVSHYEL